MMNVLHLKEYVPVKVFAKIYRYITMYSTSSVNNVAAKGNRLQMPTWNRLVNNVSQSITMAPVVEWCAT